MRVLFVGYIDHANLCHRIARALQRAGVEARVLVKHEHPAGYEEDLLLGRDDQEAKDYAASADWVVSTGDGDYHVLRLMLDGLPLRPHVLLALTHAGSAYRSHPAHFNTLDRALGARRRFVGCDSLRLTDGDVAARPYFGTAEPVEATVPAIPGPMRVTHTPLSVLRRYHKGTPIIEPVLMRLQEQGWIVADVLHDLPPYEVSRRRRAAHAHVDQLAPEVGGFGQSAIEAMGAGCVVLADIRHVATGGHVEAPPILDVRDASELESALRVLAGQPERLQRARQASLDWARGQATDEAVARYWIGQLTSI